MFPLPRCPRILQEIGEIAELQVVCNLTCSGSEMLFRTTRTEWRSRTTRRTSWVTSMQGEKIIHCWIHTRPVADMLMLSLMCWWTFCPQSHLCNCGRFSKVLHRSSGLYLFTSQNQNHVFVKLFLNTLVTRYMPRVLWQTQCTISGPWCRYTQYTVYRYTLYTILQYTCPISRENIKCKKTKR